MWAACDVQMLRGKDGQYLIKEFGVFQCCPLGDAYMIVTFAPPYDHSEVPENIQRQNQYVSKNIHGLSWETGTTPYEDMPAKLLEMTSHLSLVYVKGEEKKRFLQSLLKCAVVDAEKLGAPALKMFPHMWAPCHNEVHTTSHTCAVRNARRIGMWILYRVRDPCRPFYVE
jgi:hypothetical protein